MNNKKVYIGTLYVGENELEECKKSIKNQTFANITHEIFSYLPNKEAHDTLYSRFMELQKEYDYFIKLDADMVFVRDTIVEELVEIFENNNNLDHGVFSVHDWYSNTDIIGMSMFSKRVKWQISKEDLFVDKGPKLIGELLVYNNSPAPVAYHSPNPSIEEAFMFGYHRALKVVQRGRLKKNTNQSKVQLELLQNVWKTLTNDEERKSAVLFGAEIVFAGKQNQLDNKKDYLKDGIEELDDFNSIKSRYNFDELWSAKKFIFKARYFRYVLFHDIIQIIPKKIYKIFYK